MRFFNKPTSPRDDGESDRLLDAFGKAEREASPLRPGRFAPIAALLAGRNSASASSETSVRRPALSWGAGAALAGTVGIMALAYPPLTNIPTVSAADAAPNATANAARPTQVVDTQTLRDYADGFSATVDPVLLPSTGDLNMSMITDSAVPVPLAVTLRNPGAAFSGVIEVVSGGGDGSNGRKWSFPITVPGGNAITRKVVYTVVGNMYPRNQYTVTLDRHGVRDDLYSGWVNSSNDASRRNIAIIDTRYGVLVPRGGLSSSASTPDYNAFTIKPQNAPDFSYGYSALDVLVLGKGSESLSGRQWGAIHEWVKDGGALVFLGGDNMAPTLRVPAAQDLSPVTAVAEKRFSPDASPAIRLSEIQYRTGATATPPTVRASSPLCLAVSTAPDAESLDAFRLSDDTARTVGSEPIAYRRRLGSGTIIYFGFDPTTPEFRDRPSWLVSVWNVLGAQAQPRFSNRFIQASAIDNPWVDVRLDTSGHPMYYSKATLDGGDPFQLSLPSLETVLLIFLGYFVLVVPISFVVLKHRRTLHLAWITGPTLAVGFAGGLALVTIDLYRAGLAHRTAGMIALEAGDPVARFHGFTEMFLSTGGRQTFRLPGSQRVVDVIAGSNTGSASGSAGSLSTPVSDGDEAPPTFDTPNLTFRRFYHSETVSLGTGITAHVHIDAQDELVGSIDNGTGLTLTDARIGVRGVRPDYQWVREKYDKAGRHLYYDHYEIRRFKPSTPLAANGYWREIPSLLRYELGTVKPGHTELRIQRSAANAPLQYSLASINTASIGAIPRDTQRLSAVTPELIATTNGESFGPQDLGRSFGGDSSVTVMVHLPALSAAPAAPQIEEGGANR